MSDGCVEWAEKSPATAVWSRQDICDAVEPEEPIGITIQMFDEAISNDVFPTGYSTIAMSEEVKSLLYSPACGGPVVIESKAVSDATINLLDSSVVYVHMHDANVSVLGMPTEAQKLTMITKAISSATITLRDGSIVYLHMRGV